MFFIKIKMNSRNRRIPEEKITEEFDFTKEVLQEMKPSRINRRHEQGKKRDRQRRMRDNQDNY